MLTVQKQPKYIQKAVQLPNGAWAMVVFELIERDGHIVARAVSGKLLEVVKVEQETVLCLPCIKSPAEFVSIKSTFTDLVSTFSKDYSFMSCLVTRAPNL